MARKKKEEITVIDFEENEIITSVVPYEDSRYSKSNFLISAKYASSLLENQITAICFFKLYKGQFVEDEYGNIRCDIKAAELIKLLGANKGSFYSSLKPVAQNMTSRTIGFSDPERNTFEYISVFTKARYENGVFSIFINSDIKKYTHNLESNFTILNLSIMLSFKKNNAFRLYENLASRAFYPKHSVHDNNNVFSITYELAELKLTMGIVNAEFDSVRKELNGKQNPNYEKAVEKSPEKKFNNWYDFRRYVLDPAIKEINEKTEMTVKYDPIKGGVGGRVIGVNFTVKKNNTKYNETELEAIDVEPECTLDDTEKFIFYTQVMELFTSSGIAITIGDIIEISETANFNMDRIKKAKEIMDSSTTDITNVTGFMISAIKNNYELTRYVNSKKAKDNKFNNFEQREYSDLESMLLNSDI